MKRLFLCEKPMQAKWYVDNEIGKEGDTFLITPTITSYYFKYPSYLSYKNFPFVNKEPVYKINKDSELFNFDVFEIKDGKRQVLENQPLKAYNKELKSYYPNKEKMADLIIDIRRFIESFDCCVIAVDADHTGTRGVELFFNTYLQNYYPSSMIEKKGMKRMYPYAMDKLSLKKAEMNMEDIFEKNSKHRDYIDHYKNKDFFDYNFNINSLMIFEDMLKEVGCFNKHFIMTNFMIQTILLLKKEKSLPIVKILRMMELSYIGSPISRNEIIEQLYEQGLIQKLKQSNKGETVSLTNEGLEFANLLHQKVKSLDTKTLYEDIYKLKHDDFRDKYSKKLGVYFKKQRNFFRNKTNY